jgi:hypothetical protein
VMNAEAPRRCRDGWAWLKTCRVGLSVGSGRWRPPRRGLIHFLGVSLKAAGPLGVPLAPLAAQRNHGRTSGKRTNRSPTYIALTPSITAPSPTGATYTTAIRRAAQVFILLLILRDSVRRHFGKRAALAATSALLVINGGYGVMMAAYFNQCIWPYF